jgi:hypothetical protein
MALAPKSMPRSGFGWKAAFLGHVDPSTVPELHTLHTALTTAHTAWDSIASTHARRMADPTVNEAARLRSSAQYAKGELDRAVGTVQHAVEQARATLAQHQAKLQAALKPPTSAGEAMQDAEVRAYLRSLKAEDRTTALRQAMDAKDLGTLRAVSNAPGYLYGDTSGTSMYRDHYLEQVATEAFVMSQALAGAIAEGEKAIANLPDHVGELVDFASADRIGSLQEAA